RATLGVNLLERAPRVHIAVDVRHRPVDQVQVDVVGAELLEAGVERLERLVVALVGVPQLRGEEDVLARDVRVGDGLADLALVAVCGSGVDAAVAGLERGGDGCHRLVGADLEDAETDLRHRYAVVQCDRGYVRWCHARYNACPAACIRVSNGGLTTSRPNSGNLRAQDAHGATSPPLECPRRDSNPHWIGLPSIMLNVRR